MQPVRARHDTASRTGSLDIRTNQRGPSRSPRIWVIVGSCMGLFLIVLLGASLCKSPKRRSRASEEVAAPVGKGAQLFQNDPELEASHISPRFSVFVFSCPFAHHANMMLFSGLSLFLAFALQWGNGAAQVYFTHPAANEVVMAGVPYTVSFPDSVSAPYFHQMTDFSLLVFAGSYSNPVSPS